MINGIIVWQNSLNWRRRGKGNHQINWMTGTCRRRRSFRKKEISIINFNRSNFCAHIQKFRKLVRSSPGKISGRGPGKENFRKLHISSFRESIKLLSPFDRINKRWINIRSVFWSRILIVQYLILAKCLNISCTRYNSCKGFLMYDRNEPKATVELE